MRARYLLLLTTVCLGVVAVGVPSAQRGTARLLVLNKDDANLAIVDPASGNVLGRVPVGQGPHELVVSTDGKYAFASNYGTGPAPGGLRDDNGRADRCSLTTTARAAASNCPSAPEQEFDRLCAVTSHKTER